MANNLAQRKLGLRSLPTSTETPVIDSTPLATLAKHIEDLERTQKSLLAVQNELDTKIENLQMDVGSITASTPSLQWYFPIQLIYPVFAPNESEYSVPHDV